MECFYINELNVNSTELIFSESESKHIRAMRIKDMEKIQVSNGNGTMAFGNLIRIDKKNFGFRPERIFENYNLPKIKITLAIAEMEKKDRLEIAIEKAVELGVSSIISFVSKYSSQSKINLERINSKILSSMKQSKRSILPDYFRAINLNEIIESIKDYDNSILLHENGENPDITAIGKSVIIFCGPEGGFSSEEISSFTSICSNIWHLGRNRLRSETASIAAISQFLRII